MRISIGRSLFVWVSLLGSSGCLRNAEPPILFAELGAPSFPTASAIPEAQRWFEQGLTFYWGFNHEEATRSFERALELDPGLAIAEAYIALAYGPNINDPLMDAARSRSAHDAATRAIALAVNPTVSQRDRDLIAAVSRRYAWPQPEDRAELDRVYSGAMRDLYAAHPEDPEIATLFAESLLDLRPWDQWTRDGKPQDGTLEAVAALDHAITANPGHPGANHLTIHAIEASPNPERADRAADRLRTLVPGLAHLVHMPSHIDIRTGRYAEAIAANRRAVAADRAYSAQRPRGGVYAMYRAHNPHFIAYAAMFSGRKAVALEGLAILDEILTPDIVASLPGVLDGFLTARAHVYVRFGMWDEILAMPAPEDASALREAMFRYARGVAFAATDRIDEARVEQSAFEAAASKVEASVMLGNNPAPDVLAVGKGVLAGEIDYRSGKLDYAFTHLREAVTAFDSLRYDEPASWMMPPRHSLGALLLEQSRVDEAIAVYRTDLVQNPANVWSLHGLVECYERKGETMKDAAADARARFARANADADVEIASSCYCRRPK